MRIAAILAILGLGLVLAGSLRAETRGDAYTVQADNREALDRILAECDRATQAAALDPIRGKLELTRRKEAKAAPPPPSTYPTADERIAVAAWAAMRDACSKRVATFLDNAPLPAGANRDTAAWGNSFLVRSMAATGDLVAALGEGKLTYAEYALKRAELVQVTDAEHARWRQALQQAGRLHDAELADTRFKAYLADLAASLQRPAAPPVAGLQGAPRQAERLAKAPLLLNYPKAAARPDDIAVIVGNGDYSRGHDIPDVRPAHADAASMRLYAVKGLGVREDNVIMLTDATTAQLTAVFGSDKEHRGQLFDWVKPGRSRVFVYYAGHGAPGTDGTGPYLVPADAEASRISLTGYPLPLLYENLGKLPAEAVTVVLESCFSGQSQAGSLQPKASPIVLAPRQVAPPSNVTVIAAAASDQIASWQQDASHGLFTEFFLRGMSGDADRKPHGDGDGKVGLDELDRYLKETVTYWARRYWGRDQSAQIVQGEKAGGTLTSSQSRTDYDAR